VRNASWLVTLGVGVSMVLFMVGSALALAELGQTAPSLVVDELSGQTFDLAAMRGRVVVINFWATWCQPCRQEMPELDAFYRQYHARGIEMIGLSVDRPHDRADVRKVMQSFNYPAAILDDAKDNGFGTPSALPVTYVIDSSGVLRVRLSPNETPVTEKTLAAAVLPLLSGEPVPKTAASPQ
jgi:cytochrome c biogenesis protein CcmG, thiol:disulfide interchange protein DsbE